MALAPFCVCVEEEEEEREKRERERRKKEWGLATGEEQWEWRTTGE